MKKFFLSAFIFICFAFVCNAQNLISFTTTIQPNESAGKNYLSISDKKSYTLSEAYNNKSTIDLALVISNNYGTPKMEWYNMSGKDGIVPEELLGTATGVNTISFDKDQFDKCKTDQDLSRMTGQLTKNSFSHFASVSDDIKKGITYHCFIVQFENGKRALLWLDAVDSNTYSVIIKVQS